MYQVSLDSSVACQAEINKSECQKNLLFALFKMH